MNEIQRLIRKRKWQRLSEDVRCVLGITWMLIECIVYYADIGTSIHLGLKYLTSGRRVPGALTLLCVLPVLFTLNCYNLTLKLNSKRVVHWYRRVLSVLVSLFHLDVFIWSLKWTKLKWSCRRLDMNCLEQNKKYKQQKQFQTFFGPIPQLCLQLYLFHTHSSNDSLRTQSILTSIGSVVMTLTTTLDDYSLVKMGFDRNGNSFKDYESVWRYPLMFIWHFCTVIPRLLIISLLATLSLYAPIGLILFNTVLWIAFSIIDKPKNDLVCLVFGALYFNIGAYVRQAKFLFSSKTQLKQNHSKLLFLSYYTMFYIQNCCVGIVYFYLNSNDSYRFIYLYFIAGSFSLAVHLRFLYLFVKRRHTPVLYAASNSNKIYCVYEDDCEANEETLNSLRLLVENRGFHEFCTKPLDEFNWYAHRKDLIKTGLIIYIGSTSNLNDQNNAVFKAYAKLQLKLIAVNRDGILYYPKLKCNQEWFTQYFQASEKTMALLLSQALDMPFLPFSRYITVDSV